MAICPHCQQDRSARTIRRHLAGEARYLLYGTASFSGLIFASSSAIPSAGTLHEVEPVTPDDLAASLQFGEEIFNSDDEQKDTTGASHIRQHCVAFADCFSV